MYAYIQSTYERRAFCQYAPLTHNCTKSLISTQKDVIRFRLISETNLMSSYVYSYI
jgi:hypothetical protein